MVYSRLHLEPICTRYAVASLQRARSEILWFLNFDGTHSEDMKLASIRDEGRTPFIIGAIWGVKSRYLGWSNKMGPPLRARRLILTVDYTGGGWKMVSLKFVHYDPCSRHQTGKRWIDELRRWFRHHKLRSGPRPVRSGFEGTGISFRMICTGTHTSRRMPNV
jgi:hypothetical protein